MKNLTLAVIALVVLGIASLGFTLINEQTKPLEAKEIVNSKDKMMTDMSKLNQVQGRKEGNGLASFD